MIRYDTRRYETRRFDSRRDETRRDETRREAQILPIYLGTTDANLRKSDQIRSDQIRSDQTRPDQTSLVAQCNDSLFFPFLRFPFYFLFSEKYKEANKQINDKEFNENSKRAIIFIGKEKRIYSLHARFSKHHSFIWDRQTDRPTDRR
jgi:hypothetical protein